MREVISAGVRKINTDFVDSTETALLDEDLEGVGEVVDEVEELNGWMEDTVPGGVKGTGTKRGGQKTAGFSPGAAALHTQQSLLRSLPNLKDF